MRVAANAQAIPEAQPRCRFCGTGLATTFVDLGASPLSNSYAASEEAAKASPRYPLHARVCSACFLVQLEEFETPEQIFSEYAYFSSYSASWLKHAERFCEQSMSRFWLSRDSHVVEIASNDGYLLQYFQHAGTTVLGIEP